MYMLVFPTEILGEKNQYGKCSILNWMIFEMNLQWMQYS